MKSIFGILLSFLLIGLIVLSSCSHKVNYEFMVKNETNYTINTFRIGMGNEKIIISMKPQDSLDNVICKFKEPYFNAAEPLLSLSISKFSDSIKVYENEIGHITSVSDLIKDEINTIKITLQEDVSNTTDIFDFRINE